MIGCEECRDALGGYVLDALEPREAEAVRVHLEACEACALEHARLTPLPALLDLAGSVDAQVERPDSSLERAVLLDYERKRKERTACTQPGRVRRDGLRRRARPALAGALAGAALTAAAFALLTPAGEQQQLLRLKGSPGAPGASATARLDSNDAGTAVRLRVRGLVPTRGEEVYELWFVHRRGRISAGTFRVPAVDEVEVRLTTAARPGDYDRIGVTREPNDADPARNGPNVLAGRVAP